MQIFIYFLSILGLLSAPSASAQQTCDHVKKRPLILNVKYTEPDLQYDFTQSTLEMITAESGSRDGWLRDHGIDPATIHPDRPIITNGLSSPQFGLSFSAQAHAAVADTYKVYYCPYIHDVDIRFAYGNKITIPTEMKQGSCEFKEKLKHHLRYYNADVNAGRGAVERLKQDLPTIIQEIERAAGYVDQSKIKAAQDEMKAALKDAVRIYYDTAKKEHSDFRSKNESDESFARLSKAIKACEEKEEKGIKE